MAQPRTTTSAPAPSRRSVRLARFPTRKVILVTLFIFVLAGVTTCSYRTLTLPASEGALSAGRWRDLVVDGISRGAIYALIALGYSLVYGILLMINIAHGEVFMAGAFGSF